MNNNAGFTLAGIYNYFEIASENDESITPLYDDIELFNGGTFFEQTIEPIDKDLLIDQIIEDYGDLFVLRQIPNRFKRISDNFFKKNYKNFAKMQIALQMDFNPIYNYDRYEEWTDTNEGNQIRVDSQEYTDTRNIKPTGTETLETSQSGSEKTTNTPRTSQTTTQSTTSNGETVTQVSAYNSSNTWDNSQKVTTTNPTIQTVQSAPTGQDETEITFAGRKTTTSTTFVTRNTEDKFEHTFDGGTDRTDHESEGTHSGHLYGNIGVTTSTAMIKEFLELYDFDIYKYIADKYAKELLLKVY